MANINIPLGKMTARRDFESRVALEFYRDETTVEYLAFDPNGLQVFVTGPESFDKIFYRVLETPLERVALTLLRTLKSAYLPGDGVAETILEIYIMAKTDNTNLSALDVKGLLAIYNELAEAAGKQPLKAFKEGKPKLIARIEALKAEVAKPTAKQEAAKSEAAAAAAKRAPAAKKASAPAPKDKPAANGKAAAKPADSKKAPQGNAKSKGIGAFCMELIKAGKDNAAVLAEAKKKFPDAKTSASSVAWYRNKLKSDGEIA